MRILVAEDDGTARTALVDLLKSDGHDPVGVGSGREAVAIWAEIQPGLLVVDYRLPDMTGLEVVAQIEAAFGEPPPAILVTAQGLGGPARDTASGFGVRIFRKPVRPRELLEVIRSAGSNPSVARVSKSDL